MVWKLDGLSKYDVRRPLTPTGTNLLGLVKHLSIVEAWYFGKTFDRPFAEDLPWWDEGAEEQTDMWVTAAETRDEIVDRYRRVWLHADATIIDLPADAPGHVPWWPDRKSHCTRCLCTCWPRRTGTPAMLTSSVNSSTVRWVCDRQLERRRARRGMVGRTAGPHRRGCPDSSIMTARGCPRF